ncbi:MAG TPA: ABC transporter ATP-binding protein [Terriglobales bacterium]|nr:ABC transporter ATP-binding protein [Terriglobales bacterium]
MLVQLRDVTKIFGTRRAVDGIDLDIPAGCCFGLLGPNGAGKTTALKMIYGVARPSSGSVRVFDLDIAQHTREVRSRLGVTLQQNIFVDVLTPVENLRIFGRYHLLREPELGRRIDELIAFLELQSHADVPVKNLSGGFQRRLAIAMSLVNRPELLVLDEPTTGLDPAVRMALWGRIRQLRTGGTTVLLTTHYMDEAQRLCDRIAILSQGRVIDQGSPQELIRRRVAAHAVEVDCASYEEATLLEGIDVTRRLRSGDRLILYLDEPATLAARIAERDPDDRRALVVRPSNLEDVFLALTGTTLE